MDGLRLCLVEALRPYPDLLQGGARVDAVVARPAEDTSSSSKHGAGSGMIETALRAGWQAIVRPSGMFEATPRLRLADLNVSTTCRSTPSTTFCGTSARAQTSWSGLGRPVEVARTEPGLAAQDVRRRKWLVELADWQRVLPARGGFSKDLRGRLGQPHRQPPLAHGRVGGLPRYTGSTCWSDCYSRRVCIRQVSRCAMPMRD